LQVLKEKLDYQLTLFLNIDSSDTWWQLCPSTIASQTVSFAVRLGDGLPVVIMDRCG